MNDYGHEGTLQFVDAEHREVWFEPDGDLPRLIVHPAEYDNDFLTECLKTQNRVMVRGQLLPRMRIVTRATVELAVTT